MLFYKLNTEKFGMLLYNALRRQYFALQTFGVIKAASLSYIVSTFFAHLQTEILVVSYLQK